MHRKRNIILVSHCILNQNTVVEPLARSEGPYYNIIKEIIDKGIGIHQIPCPEFKYLGLKREPMTKEEYDTKSYRQICRDISKDTIDILKEYIENDYNIVGLIGVNKSPTCSVRDRQGIYIEEFTRLLKENNLHIKMIDLPTNYKDGKGSKEFIKELRSFM